MTSPQPLAGLLDIQPYAGGESEITGVDRVIKLASNEGALGPSPKAVAAVHEAAGDMHRYADGDCSKLRAAIAEQHGLEFERIVCGSGSDEMIYHLCRAYAGPGDEVLHSAHGFAMYPIYATAAGATAVAAPERDITADVDALLARVTERTKLLFIANPNNPTGTYLDGDELARLRNGLPDHILLVVDSAYAEYVSRNDYDSGRDMVRAGDNVVMLRTFSKIYALGGIRLGWAYCPDAVVDIINRIRSPFNVSCTAQAAGLAAMMDTEFVTKSRIHNDTWLAWLTEQLRGLDLTVPDSFGNFVLVRFPETPGRDAETADAFLKSRGIIVRRMAGYGLPDALRITIGLEDEMHAVVDTLREFLG
jgi:histidinol-phosphate aminotransferase